MKVYLINIFYRHRHWQHHYNLYCGINTHTASVVVVEVVVIVEVVVVVVVVVVVELLTRVMSSMFTKLDTFVFPSELDECAPNPCLNDGTCFHLTYGFECVCQSGWTGEACETSKNTLYYYKSQQNYVNK